MVSYFFVQYSFKNSESRLQKERERNEKGVIQVAHFNSIVRLSPFVFGNTLEKTAKHDKFQLKIYIYQ